MMNPVMTPLASRELNSHSKVILDGWMSIGLNTVREPGTDSFVSNTALTGRDLAEKISKLELKIRKLAGTFKDDLPSWHCGSGQLPSFGDDGERVVSKGPELPNCD